jgi:NAD(P)-dependent dehydrogenase (short-subunit alcohol dehydrogenase family)
MSFSCGNFVTLTNLSDEGLERIIRLKLSPLYISVHTMNPDLRVKLLRNRFAGKIVDQIDRLVKGGVEMHCQAVLVPGENDGDELAYTARKLFSYYPAVRDLACVPTGITKYRDGLYPISDVDKAYSEKLLDLVDELNKEFGVDFLLPADEYFVKAGRPLKNVDFYGDFEQIENGIGMTVKFLEETDRALTLLKQGGRVVITTSELAPLDPLPFTGLYAVTKGALDKYAYSLRMELQLLDVSVSVLRAGAVSTGMLGVSTTALDRFCEKTTTYQCNAKRFKKIVNGVEAKCVAPEKIAGKVSKILSKKKPKFVYTVNRNKLLLLLNALPKGIQCAVIKKILK